MSEVHVSECRAPVSNRAGTAIARRNGHALPVPEIISPRQRKPATRKGKRAPAAAVRTIRESRSEYTPGLGHLICDRLAEGRTLRDVCRDKDIPVDERTVRRWAMNAQTPFAQEFEMARLIGFLSIAEEMLEIADDGSNDWANRITRNGHTIRTFDYEHVERSKLRIETRKWLLAKALPKMFGRHLPARPEGEGSGGDSFLAILRYLNSDLASLALAWQRVQAGEVPENVWSARLMAMYQTMGCPTLRDVAPPAVAKQIEREVLLERYEAVQLAFAVTEEEAAEKAARKAQRGAA